MGRWDTTAPEGWQALPPSLAPARILVDGLDHPEGVCWDPDYPSGGCLYAGGEDGQLYRVGLGTGSVTVAARTGGGMVLGVTVDGRGRVILCAPGARALCVWDALAHDKVAHPVLSTLGGRALVQPNFSAFAPDGTLYVSDSGTWGAADGCLLELAPDGESRVFSRDPRHFTNGLAVSPDGRHLWCAESYDPVLTVFDLTDPSPRAQRVHRFDGCVLDGLAPTADGGLLVSCYRPDRIYHLTADGALTVIAEDRQGTLLGAPTNVAFAGDALDVVVAANLGRWHLTLLDLGLQGAPLHRPERWALDSLGLIPCG